MACAMEVAKIEVDSKSKDEEKESFIMEIPSVIVVSDQLFISSGKCKLLQLKQVGGLIGYYWKIDVTNRVPRQYNLCLGASDDKAMFKIYTMVNDQNEEIFIIESVSYPNKVIALDKVNDRVIIKNCPMAPTRIRKQDLISNQDILLKRIPYKSSAERFMFQFFTKGYGLGFENNGKPMAPSTVRLNQAESIFRFV